MLLHLGRRNLKFLQISSLFLLCLFFFVSSSFISIQISVFLSLSLYLATALIQGEKSYIDFLNLFEVNFVSVKQNCDANKSGSV